MLVRRASWRGTITLLTVGILLTGALAFAGADATDSIKNWKELMPEAEFTKLVSESAKLLQEYTRSPGSFNQNGKKLQNEAYSLAIVAEVARQASDGENQLRAAALQQVALELAAAAKQKNLEEAKKLSAAVAAFKKTAPPADAKAISLREAVPIHNLMEEVQALYKKMQEWQRMASTAYNQKVKPEEATLAGYRMAAYSVAITAHVPDKEQLKDKTEQDWLGPTEDMRKATLDIAAAAKAKKHADLKSAIRRMDSACTKCHDNFRIDTD
jgi:cytochrome c556